MRLNRFNEWLGLGLANDDGRGLGGFDLRFDGRNIGREEDESHSALRGVFAHNLQFAPIVAKKADATMGDGFDEGDDFFAGCLEKLVQADGGVDGGRNFVEGA